LGAALVAAAFFGAAFLVVVAVVALAFYEIVSMSN
jgi:hypothetical protein